MNSKKNARVYQLPESKYKRNPLLTKQPFILHTLSMAYRRFNRQNVTADQMSSFDYILI